MELMLEAIGMYLQRHGVTARLMVPIPVMQLHHNANGTDLTDGAAQESDGHGFALL